MKEFSVKRPVLFEMLLIIASFAAVVVFMLGFAVLGGSADVSTGLCRIIVAVLLMILFRHCFKDCRPFSGFVLALPALLFAVWNVAGNLIMGQAMIPSSEIGGAVIAGLAPAMFEEVLFRGIFIYNLKANGKSDRAALVISAVLFGALHLTEIIGGNVLGVLIQTGYATVIGLVFGAVYLRSRDIVTVILIHFLIDFCSRLFGAGASATTTTLIALAVLLVIETVYAFWITPKDDSAGKAE